MGLLEEIGRRLSTQSVATTSATSTGWRLAYRGFLPSTHDQQVAVIATGGFQQLAEESDNTLSRPTFQVLVRGRSTGSTGLETKVDGVINALNLFSGTLVGRAYKDIRIEGEPLWLGRDENQRPMMSCNFSAFRSRTT